MSLQDSIIHHFSDSAQTLQDTLKTQCELIEYAGQRLVNCLLNDKKILVCGNGGAAACAQMLAAAMLNRFERSRPALPAVVLGGDSVTLTSVAGDHHFDEVFAKPLRALGQAEDLLVVYCDGNYAANLAKAIGAAHDKELSVLALTGGHGGMIASLLRETDIEIRVPAHAGARIREAHVLITHCLCALIDQQLFGAPYE